MASRRRVVSTLLDCVHDDTLHRKVLDRLIQEKRVRHFVEGFFSSERPSHVAESDKDMFLTENSIYVPNVISEKFLIQTPHIDESPSCHFHIHECKHKGSTFCVEHREYFCSWDHMLKFMNIVGKKVT
jgi:hypothetical protein